MQETSRGTKRSWQGPRSIALVLVGLALALVPDLSWAVVVNSTADTDVAGDGACTLREAVAIDLAGSGNAGGDCAGPSTPVSFDIPGSGPHVIQLDNKIVLSGSGGRAVVVDGSTQPGNADVCTEAIADRPAYQIVIDGGGTVGRAFEWCCAGLEVTLKGLNIRNFSSHAIVATQTNNVNLQCNFIGTDETGTVDMGNRGHGVLVTGDSVVGIQIGGTEPGQGNLISGNNDTAIFFSGPNGSTVQGNYIGTDKSGLLPLGNGAGTHYRSGATNHLFGGTVPGAGNIVAFNRGTGIYLDSPSSLRNDKNSYLGNSVFQNGGLGLDIDEFGVLANDNGDADNGANKRMNHPELTSASLSGSNVRVTYRVTSLASNQTYPLRVEFFYADVDGQEGQTYLGFQSYTSANQTRTAVLSTPGFGTRVVATATDADGNTSEFSPSIAISGLPPNLAITKTDGVTTAVPGGNVTYTIVASNVGTEDDPAARVRDTFPSDLTCTYSSSTSGGASGNDSGSGNIDDTINLPVGGSVTYTANCAIDSGAVGTLSNTATITASSSDGDPSDNSATDDDTVLTPQVDVSVTKAVDGSAAAGGTVTFTVVATNAGPSDDPAMRIVDTPPSVLSCAWTSLATGGASGNSNSSGNLDEVLSMPAGSTVTYTMVCGVDLGVSGLLSNRAEVIPSESDSDATNNARSVLFGSGTASLETVKTGPMSAMRGETIEYTVRVFNRGTLFLDDVSISDPFPSQLENCSYTAVDNGLAFGFTGSGTGNIADTGVTIGGSNSSVIYTVTCRVRDDASGVASNTATATTGFFEADTSDNAATVNTRIFADADLSITKTDGLSEVDAGGNLTYTIVAANNGPLDDPSARVTDSLPSDLTCTWTSVAAGGASGNITSSSGDIDDTIDLPSGGSVTYTVSCSVADGASGVLSNTATIASSIEDPDGSNNSATDSTSVRQRADISVTKTDGASTATPGGSTTYTVVVSNAGPSDDPSVSLNDTLPAALTCSYTSLAAGGASGNTLSGSGSLSETLVMPASSWVTYTLVCNIDAAASGSLSNTASVVGSFDGTNGNDSATDTNTLAGSADISVTKTDGLDASTPGGSTTYTVLVSNAGPSDDPSVGLTDTLPSALTCTYTSVASGGASGNTPSGSGSLSETLSIPASSSVTYTLTCDIDAAATGSLSNTASVVGSFDGTSGNDSATDTNALAGEADISVTKTDGVDTSTPGGSTIYTVLVSNAGPSDDPSVSLTDILASDLSCTYTSVAAGGASGNTLSGGGDLTETLSMPASSSVTYTLTCDIDPAATGTLANTASVVGSFDTASSNNSATDTNTLQPSADISVSKTDGATTSTPGGSTTYTIVVTNVGPSVDPAVDLVDTLPSSLSCTYTSAASGGASGNTVSGSGSLSETLFMPVLSSVTYTLVCDIDPAATGTLSNTVTTMGSFDLGIGHDSATDTNTLQGSADISVSKTDGTTTAIPGGSTTYTVIVTNVGPSVDPAVSLVDTLPPSLSCTYSSVAAGGASGNTASGSGSLSDTLSMPVLSSVTYTLVCDIDPAATGTLSNTATATGSFDLGIGNDSATDTNTLQGSADISVSKTDGTTTAIPGGSTTYTVTVTNVGPSVDPAVSLVDTLPASLTCTYSSVAAGGASGNTVSGSGSLSDTLSMPVLSSVTYTLVCDIDPAATGTLSNTATATGSFDNGIGNNSATDSNTLQPSADISVTKTDGATTAIPGGSTTYTIVATNLGPSVDPSVSLLDTLPASLSCTYSSLAVGGASGNTASGSGSLAERHSMPVSSSVTYTLVCDIDPAATGTLSNTATVTGSFDNGAGNNSATDSNTLQPSADISVTKTDGATTSTPGQRSIYTIVVTNLGPSEDPSVSLVDTVPPSLDCTYNSLATGGASGNTSGSGDLSETLSMPVSSSVRYTFACNIDPAATGTVSNTASVAGSFDSNASNDSATDTNTLEPRSDIGVFKDNGTTVSTPGGTTTYTIDVLNFGPSDDPTVTVTDTLSAALSCTYSSVAVGGATGNTSSGAGDLAEILDMPNGSQVTYTLVCDIDSAATGSLVNTATVSGSGDDGTGKAGNVSTDTDTLQGNADISVTKTDGVDTATPGGSTTYTVVVSNAGPSDDRSVVVTDTLPASLVCTYTSVASGGATGNTPAGSGSLAERLSMPASSSVTYTLVCDIDSAATGSLLNTASVAGSYDGTAGNDSATDTNTLEGNADISVTKTDGVDTATPGGSTTYTVVVSNAGPSDDPSVGLTDSLPSALGCTYTSVAAGGASGNTLSGSGDLSETLVMPASSSVTYTLVCDIDSAATGTLVNTATVAGSYDTTAGNDSATDTNTLESEADVAVTKSNGTDTLVPGLSTTYTIFASNSGPSDDPSVRLTDILPSPLACTFTSVAAGGASGNTLSGSGDLDETLDLPAGASVTYNVDCDIDAVATGSVANTASLAGSFDDNAANDSATDTDALDPLADISISKGNGTDSVVPGRDTVYTITVRNIGPSVDPSVAVSDTLTSALDCTWTSLAAGGATGNTASGTGDLSETLSMPANSEVVYTLTCGIDSAATGSLANTATAAGSFDDNAANNSATDTDTLDPDADISITKSDGADNAVPGQSTTYTLVASNAGPSDDPAVGLSDVLPGTLTCTWTSLAAGGAAGNTLSGSGSLTETLSMPAGASVTYTLDCDIDSAAVGTLVNTATVNGSFDDDAANDSATDTNTLEPIADVAVTKSDGVDTVVPGTSTLYTIVATNLGPSDDPAVLITDNPPTGLSCSWTSSAAGGASGNSASGTGVLAESLALPAAATVTYTYTCGIASEVVGTVSNTATLVGSFDPNADNDIATDAAQAESEADIEVTKTNTTGTAIPGTPVAYQVTVTNGGPSDDPSVAIADLLPASLDCTWTSSETGATGSNGSGSGDLSETVAIEAGGQVSYTFDCDIDPAAVGTLANTATAAGSFDPVDSNDSDTATDKLSAFDYGDAPDPLDDTLGNYPTRVASDGARHLATGPMLGLLRDTEDDGQPNSTATGDDLATDADEDGAVFATLVACESSSVTVTASAAAILDGWVDFNQDGDWTDEREQVFDSVAVVAGVNSLSATVPCDLEPGETFARLRLSTRGELEPAGLALDGEVEDYAVTVAAYDFGDAPDPLIGVPGAYPTLLANDGARHRTGGRTLRLGQLWDAEVDGQPSVGSSGDDTAGVDDEDSVDFSAVELVGGQSVTVPVTVTSDGMSGSFLNVWIDFDRDGVFAAGEEQIAVDLPVSAVEGPQQVDLSFTVPASVTTGRSYARLRLSSESGLVPTGEAPDGEVEDYPVDLIALPTLSVSSPSVREGTGGTSVLSFTLTRDHNLSTASVTVASADGTAVAPADYVAIGPQLIALATGGALSSTVEVTVQGDAMVELDETLTLQLSSPVAIVVPNEAVGTIVNDDSATVSLAPVTELEGDSGLTPFIFVATLDGAVDTSLQLSAGSVDGTATTADGDYVPVADLNVVFAGSAGEQQTVTVDVQGDEAIELHEAFDLVLSSLEAGGRDVSFEGGGETLSATGTVLNDDATLVIGDVTAAEGNAGTTAFEFRVTLDGPIDGGFDVAFASNDDTATATGPEADYAAVAASLAFAGSDGEVQTVTVQVNGDTLPEPNETFFVRLGAVTGDGALPEVADGEGLGTIEDDDDPEPPFVASIGSNAGNVTRCAQLRTSPLQVLTVRIEDNHSEIVGGDRPEDYLLLSPGPDNNFATESCDAGAVGDDVAISFSSVGAVSGPGSLTATLALVPSSGLAPGPYRLLVCDSITDEAMRPLDGDGDGVDGGDLTVPFFRSDPGNLLANGHFDGEAPDCPAQLEPWVATAELPDLVELGEPGGDDEAGSTFSTSALARVETTGGAGLGQCLELAGSQAFRLSARARREGPAVQTLVELGCTFSNGSRCQGAVIGESSGILALTELSGNWETLSARIAAPPGAVSAVCGLLTAPAGGAAAYDIYFDNLSLRVMANDVIFLDGFESGDLSAWQ